jgi:signal transduction histidine kinase
VRRIATELRPPILDDLGLIAALEWQLGEFQRRARVSCKISSNIENVELGDDFAITVFRIFQESLTNIMRHADAKSVKVDLTEKDNKLVLRIEDNGKGIAEENRSAYWECASGRVKSAATFRFSKDRLLTVPIIQST